MAGIFDYKRYINIFATAEDIKETFPRDQYSLTWDMDGLGADGWTCDIDWMTLIIDKVNYTTGEPNFDGSNVIGYFPGSTTSTVQVGTTIVLPANMYTGPILPGGDTNIPATIVNLNWSKGTLNFQRQLMLIQNWEPGTEIGDPENDENYTPIAESYPINVVWELNTYTAYVGESIDVVATATSAIATPISNTASTRLLLPTYFQISTSTLTATNFVDGLMTGTFYLYDDFVDKVLVPESTFTITTSTLTPTTYSITADISRNHNLRVQWLYDKTTGYRGGRTAFKTLTVSTTRDFVYVGQPLGLSLSVNTINQRSGDASIFTVSHDKVNNVDITGLLSVEGFFTPGGSTVTQTISLGTGTFNVNGVFTITQVLATGTYVLQATYGGNVGDNIFREMYLSTVSNVLTHYVELGRAFTLTEMLIQEGPDYDYLYAHAIDDGRTTGEIGGLVTFYHNGNTIGTSTFVRHTYNWPITNNTVQQFNLMPSAGTYPWPNSPELPTWNNNYPYGRNASPSDYTLSNPEYPTFYATFKPNSTELDWPPTESKINTLGLVNKTGGGIPQMPFKVEIPNPLYNPNTSGSNATIVLTCVEYLGTVNIPSYPSQILNIKPEYNNNLSSFSRGGGTWFVFTAPNAPSPRGRNDLEPRYDNNNLTRGQVRPNGTKYFVTAESGDPFEFWVDLGDAWPNSYLGPVRAAVSNVMVFRFLEEVPPPTYITGVNALPENFAGAQYGRKTWYNYGTEENSRCTAIYNAITGGGISDFNLIIQTGVNTVYSRSHLATKILPRGAVPTTGTFTATFGGTLDQGIEGYYGEGIPFMDSAKTEIVTDQFPGGRLKTYYRWTAINPPRVAIKNTMWLNPVPNFAIEPFTQYGTGNMATLYVNSLASSTVYVDALKPVERFYPTQLSVNYQKSLGWLSRRSAPGIGSVTLMNPNNTATTVSVVTATITTIPNTTETVTIVVGNQSFVLDKEINLPVPVRYNTFPTRSGNIVPDDFYLNRLRMISATKYTTSTTSTVVYPVRLNYAPTVGGLESSEQFLGVKFDPSFNIPQLPLQTGITFKKGTAIAFTSTNQAFLQTPPEQAYLVYQSTLDLPWRYIGTPGGQQIGWIRELRIGSSQSIVRYKIRPPVKVNDQPLYWYPQWKVERWSMDGSTLLGTVYSSPSQAKYVNSDATLPDTEISIVQNGFDVVQEVLVWNSYLDDGISRMNPPDPTPLYLYKVFLVLQNSSATKTSPNSEPVTWNQVIGSGSYGKITGPISNGLVQKNAEWEFENILFILSTTNTDGSEQIIYTTNQQL